MCDGASLVGDGNAVEDVVVGEEQGGCRGVVEVAHLVGDGVDGVCHSVERFGLHGAQVFCLLCNSSGLDVHLVFTLAQGDTVCLHLEDGFGEGLARFIVLAHQDGHLSRVGGEVLDEAVQGRGRNGRGDFTRAGESFILFYLIYRQSLLCNSRVGTPINHRAHDLLALLIEVETDVEVIGALQHVCKRLELCGGDGELLGLHWISFVCWVWCVGNYLPACSQ